MSDEHARRTLHDSSSFVDTEGMAATLESYGRCQSYDVADDGTITAKSGKYPHWRRFQRDLHGPTVNIQGHGYVMTHVHNRKMLDAEMLSDPDAPCPKCNDIEYQDRPEVCIVTLTPVMDHIQEGRDGPEVRA